MQEKHYEVVVVGGGISGCALLYTLARYTDIKSIALLEKYEGVATLNSKGTANSQTIHCGDIETNYTLEKARKTKRTSDMIIKYGLQHGYNE
ncbi:MAG: FAD-dependent oxidoreductase, partial [Campylobacter sp.]|nr:FAD-dependent oxidoreductase [Campylobacter sp.]